VIDVPGNLRRSAMTVGPRRPTYGARPFDGTTGGRRNTRDPTGARCLGSGEMHATCSRLRWSSSRRYHLTKIAWPSSPSLRTSRCRRVRILARCGGICRSLNCIQHPADFARVAAHRKGPLAVSPGLIDSGNPPRRSLLLDLGKWIVALGLEDKIAIG
jgi:hypothetical protein